VLSFGRPDDAVVRPLGVAGVVMPPRHVLTPAMGDDLDGPRDLPGVELRWPSV
jgi:hypothetical protein